MANLIDVNNLTAGQITILILVTLWLSGSVYFVGLFISRKWMLRHFKSDFAVPVLGNCYSLETLSFMGYLAKLKRKFGRIFSVFPFAKAYLVICDPVIVRRVLSDTKTFIKGGDYKEIFAFGFGQGLVTSSGEKHTKDRALFSKYFVRSNISKYVDMINQSVVEIMDSKITPKLNSDMNVESFFATLALRVFLQFSMNTSFKHDPDMEEELCQLVSQGSWATARMATLNLPMWSIFPTTRLISYARGRLMAECNKAVAKRRAELAAGTAEDVDDCLSVIIRENMSEKDLADHIITLVCAGHDTTAYFSAFMTLLLAEHPEAQDKLREEILSVVGDSQHITMEDISKLIYLQKVMQETLRLYAVIPLVTREVSEEVTIKEAGASGVTLPKGANLMIPFYLLNRDPTCWTEPSKFNPDRFDSKCGSVGEFTNAKAGYFPFGYGSRTCIGNTLAQTENGIFMCHLLRKFRFVAIPGFKPAIYGGISLTTSNGIHVVVEPL